MVFSHKNYFQAIFHLSEFKFYGIFLFLFGFSLKLTLY